MDTHPTESGEGGLDSRRGARRSACFPSRFSAGFRRPNQPRDLPDLADEMGFGGCRRVLPYGPSCCPNLGGRIRRLPVIEGTGGR
jgi:hypothetical protein